MSSIASSALAGRAAAEDSRRGTSSEVRPAARGRGTTREIGLECVGEISAEEWQKGLTEGFGANEAPSLHNIRHSHHQVARLLARGTRPVEVAAITGYTPTRIYQLQQDPAFQELQEAYSTEVEGVFANTLQRMQSLSLDAIEEMQQRLLDRPEDFDNADLIKLATAMLDRSGHGPSSTTNHNHGVDSSVLEALKARAAQLQGGTVIDAQSYQPTNQRPSAAKVSASGMGSGEEASEGQPGEGAHL